MQTITLQIEDIDWRALEDEIVNPEEWINGFVSDRARRHKDRLVAKEQQALIDDPTAETIPATVEGILESYFGHVGYQTRAEQVAAESEASEEP